VLFSNNLDKVLEYGNILTAEQAQKQHKCSSSSSDVGLKTYKTKFGILNR
jgi:hypothetical protein